MTGSQQPFISLIIPTYRRELVLVDCLRCALAQMYQNLEILVIDQTESHAPATRDYLNSVKDKVRWIPFSPPSAVTARNFGLREAKGEILVFIDDDTTFGKEFISSHLRAHLNGADVVQGRVVEEGRGISYRSQWMLPWLRVVGSNTFDKNGPTNTLTGCNFSLSRSACEQVGEFDTNYSGALIREDADYGCRCFKAGLKMIFDADACLVHHRDPEGGVDAGIKAVARIFEPDVLRNELYFARKHFMPPIVWQYKLRLRRRLRRAINETGFTPQKPIGQLLNEADGAAKTLLKAVK